MKKIANKLKNRFAKEKYLRFQRKYGSFCFVHINKCGGTSVEKALEIPVKMHNTAMEWKKMLGKDRWSDIFSFSVVRHPYMKACSHYRYRVKTNQTGLNDKQVGLNEWIKRAYGEKDSEYYDQPVMFAPCLDWLTDENGNVMVDYIAHLENIREEWPLILENIGSRSPLPKKNDTERNQAGIEELDKESIDILRNHFRKDFEYFGYKW